MPNPSEIERDNQPADVKSAQDGLQAMLTWLQESIALGTVQVRDSLPLGNQDLRNGMLIAIMDRFSSALDYWRMVESLNALTAERDAAREEAITLHEEILKHEKRALSSAREQYLHDEIARLRGRNEHLEQRIRNLLAEAQDKGRALGEKLNSLRSKSAAKLGPIEAVLRKLAATASVYQGVADYCFVMGVKGGILTVGDLRACAAWVRDQDAVKESLGERVAITEDDGESD